MLSTATAHPPHRGSYRDLPAWQRAMDLMAACYALTRRLPERDGLAARLQRASLAVVASIAEGTGRRTRDQRIHQLAAARTSLLEVEALLCAAERLGCADAVELSALAAHVDETRRRLLSLARAMGGGVRAD